MAGTITHYWNGSILTVTSDSGTSSADLSGPTGCRGPQGRPGVVYDEEGNLIIGDVPSGAEVDNLAARVGSLEQKIDEGGINVDLTGYATENYVDVAIAKAQLEGAEVDLSGFVTQDELEDAISEVSSSSNVMVDGKTILQKKDGTIYTAIGGSIQEGSIHHLATGLYYVPRHWVSGGANYDRGPLTNVGKPFTEGVYSIKVTFQDGFVEEREVECKEEGSEFGWQEYYNGGQPERLSYFGGNANGEVFVETRGYDCVVIAIEINKGGFVCIDANFIPVDESTIYVNDAGKLACAVAIGEEGLDLSNYYTKAQIDALIGSLNVGDIPSSEEVFY